MGRLLNWGASWHAARAEAPCIHCHEPTFLRDDDRAPSHKVCAEKALEVRDARAASNYQKGQF